jgi:hypothetical protein
MVLFLVGSTGDCRRSLVLSGSTYLKRFTTFKAFGHLEVIPIVSLAAGHAS